MRPLLLAVLTVLTAASGAMAQPTGTIRVAVLYFDYEGKDEELVHLRKGLASMLISDLSASAGVELVERGDLEKVLSELKLQRSRHFDKRTVARVGRGLGAQLIVTGRYFVFRGKLAVNAKVIDVETFAVKGVRSARPTDEFFSLEQELAGKIDAVLAARAGKRKTAPKRKPGKTRRTRKPKSLKARTAARYGRALDAIDSGDKKKARALLEKVVGEQPDFALARKDLVSIAR